MQIQLKQDEIFAAIKLYVVSKGFSLEGKAVAIDFTAGRKPGGLTAEITIDEQGIPGFDGAEEDTTTTNVVSEETAETVEEVKEATTEEAPAATEAVEQNKPSLFGSSN